MVLIPMKSSRPQASGAEPEPSSPNPAIPPVEILQEARELLSRRVGPCAAASSELVLVTAREIMSGMDRGSQRPATG